MTYHIINYTPHQCNISVSKQITLRATLTSTVPIGRPSTMSDICNESSKTMLLMSLEPLYFMNTK